MLNQEDLPSVNVPVKQPSSSPSPDSISNDDRDALNDHDYCSPNKKSSQQDKNLAGDEIVQMNNSTALMPDQCLNETSASTSTKTNRNINNNDDAKISQNQENIETSKLTTTKTNTVAPPTYSNDDLSDASSTSSSSISSSVSSGQSMEVSNSNQPAAPNVRARRARQSTSVTDKSEWITGEDQIDSVLSEHLDDERPGKSSKRKPSKDFSLTMEQYTSSDYSSSDAESDDDSDDDDPDKLWCVCQRPHGDRFMINCDVCDDWYHGQCVNVTKLMGERFEKEGKEWICADCQEKLRSGITRNAIPKKSSKKDKKKKTKLQSVPGKRGRGRPRKSERDGPVRVSMRTTRKSSSSLDPKHGVDNGRLRRNLARSDIRSESYDSFEDQVKLRKLIKERKKEFFHKRHLAEQQNAAKRNQLGLNRQSLTANLSDSLDSLATSTSTPNMNNLPINIKSEHKPERPKPNIVLQINTKKDSGSNQNSSGTTRIVTAIVRSPKKPSKELESSSNPFVNDIFTAEPIQVSKKPKLQVTTSTTSPPSQPSASSSTTPAPSGDNIARKRAGSVSKNGEHDQTSPKRKRKDSESSTPNGSTQGGSKHIAQKIKDTLESRSSLIKDLEVSSDKIETLANDIETQLNECFTQGTQKYLNKFRSLLFNLRDPKNEGLIRNVLTEEIPPARLVRMSSDEMASHELAKWRERENKHSIELIKRDAEMAAQQVIVKKTHKGEEVIPAPSIIDPDDPTAENQEIPTTPTKTQPKEVPKTPTINPKPAGSLKMVISGLTTDSKTVQSQDKLTSCPATPNDSKSSTDINADQSNHALDDSSKHCNNQSESVQDDPESIKDEKPSSPAASTEEQVESEQPRRLRISISTNLDPANLSRLKVPLIVPTQETTEGSRNGSPNAWLETPDKIADNDDVYDPATPPTFSDPNNESSVDSSQICWSGSITMPEISKFSASAKPLGESADFMRSDLSDTLMVCGRIAPDQMQGYTKKLKTTTKNQIILIQLFPKSDEDKDNFNTFFDYLYQRNRYGVIQTNPQVLKDFYVLPIHERSSVPEVLRNGRNSELDRTEPNCLLGVLVRNKRSTVAPIPSESTYTPTPIK